MTSDRVERSTDDRAVFPRAPQSALSFTSFCFAWMFAMLLAVPVEAQFGDSRDKVGVTAVASTQEVAPGGDLPIAITFTVYLFSSSYSWLLL